MPRLSHSTVVVEDILVSPREIPPILHNDDKEPIASLSSCLRFELGQDSNRVLFQVFKFCGILSQQYDVSQDTEHLVEA